MAQDKIPTGPRMYPVLDVPRIANPNRMWAFPIFGFVVKLVVLIPVFFWLMLLGLAVLVVGVLINPLVVLFTGKYWQTSYELVSGYIKLGVKASFFLVGLTNKYPGFSLTIEDAYKVGIDMPKTSNRLYAIPVLGGIIRLILLIPYLIWETIINYGAGLGIVVSFVPVLFMGKYPETTYELFRDYTRLNVASTMYLFGLSDTYPSFWISKNHLVAKIILIILGMVLYSFNVATQDKTYQKEYERNYQYDFDSMQQGGQMMQDDSGQMPQETTY